MSFGKSVLAVIVGVVISFLVVGVLLFFIAVGFTAAVLSSDEETPILSENTVLKISLSGPISERLPEDPLAELLGENQIGIDLLGTIQAIAHAKDDPNISGIYIEHGFLSGGYGAIEEIRAAIEDFKSSGKFVYSYGEFMSEANYYVASVSDEIYLHPQGIFEFNGLSANVTFFKGLFDKLEVEPQIFRVGAYKSAVEPFMRKDLSEANQEQMTSFINAIYDYYLQQVAASRNIPLDELRSISDKMEARSAAEALEKGLITKVAYVDEIKSLIREKLGLEEQAKIRTYPLGNYMKVAKAEQGFSLNKIAVIVAEGEIVNGEGNSRSVGSAKFAKTIRKARENKRIKAVVLRVNSPGGILLASDVIWREIMLTKKVKPVIASMSSVAASGGYYLSMPCDTIVAQPTTITGSIGIFGMMLDMSAFLENKLGITNQAVNTGEFSDIYTVTRPLNDMEKRIIQSSVEAGYDDFTRKAAEGRRMAIEAIEKAASGRVWTGSQAKEHGLVDILGSFGDAVNIAAEKAGISDDHMLTYYPELKSPLEELFENMIGEVQAKWTEAQYGIMADYVDKIKKLAQYQGIQARLPFDVELK